MTAAIRVLPFVYAAAVAGALVTGTSLVTLLASYRSLAGLGLAFALSAAAAMLAALSSRLLARRIVCAARP